MIATPIRTSALTPCSAPKPEPTSRDSAGSTRTCRTTSPKITAASITPFGTFAKKDTISRTSEVSGIRISPLKNMWIAKPHSAVKFWSQSSHSSSSLLTTPPRR